jgi:hypothetical protein
MELIEFEWLRCLGGYAVVPTRGKVVVPGRKSVPVRTVPRRPTAERPPNIALSTAGEQYFQMYRPTEFPTLFQIFADMPATPEGMCEFFNRFGPLQWFSERFALPEVAPGWHSHSLLIGDVLAHHAALRRAIDLFKAGNLSELSHGFDRGGWGLLRTKLRPQSASRVAIVLVPSSLLQFLWLQLAQYAGSNAQLFRCEQCSHPFLVGSKTGRRSKAKYCSDACRLAAFRERHGAETTDPAHG